jgi:cytochrome c-type biogenesis protein CcmH
VLATLLLTVDSSDSGAASKPSVGAVAEGLTCQCGCGLTVANCNHPQCEFSVPVRDQIEKMIADGRSREQIITMFRVKYGEKILSAPTTTGFNLLAWVMPFGVIVGGGGLLLAVLSRWRGKRRGSAPSNERAEFFDPELRRRLEDELREDA